MPLGCSAVATRGRHLHQANTSVPTLSNITANTTGNITGNATGNTTADDRSRRNGFGEGRDEPIAYCGSINCGARKLLQDMAADAGSNATGSKPAAAAGSSEANLPKMTAAGPGNMTGTMAGNMTGNMTGNLTGNATTGGDRSRRGGGGDGWGGETYQPVYCGSINCLRRKLFGLKP